MTTYEEALATVKELNNRLDFCAEYEKCYVFSKKNSQSYGGADEPAVVVKETGECIIFISALSDGLLHGEPIKEDYIKNW